MSKEGYKYVCSKCKEVDELRNKLQGNQSNSKGLRTDQEKEKSGKKNKNVKGKIMPYKMIIGGSIVRV